MTGRGADCLCGVRVVEAPSESGRVSLCPQCARAHSSAEGRNDQAITWNELELELGNRSTDLFAFTYIRNGVPPAKRMTLTELERTGGRFRAAERSGAALGAVFVLSVLILIIKAVLL